jgi:hypothetical protein
MVSFVKSLGWLLLTVGFGLLQLWLNITSSTIIKGVELNEGKILMDGVLLFFITALVTTITIDYYFAKLEYPKWAVGILFVLFPLLIILVSTWLYGMCFRKTYSDININTLKGYEYSLFVMTALYALFAKTLQFKNKG